MKHCFKTWYTGSMENRFKLKIEVQKDGCWKWLGYKNKSGYGSFYALGETLAHRFSYRFYVGDIPKGLMVCHTCDNPSCVNPKHLWVGTSSDNQQDCVNKGRARRNSPVGSKNGLSKLTEANIIRIRGLKEKGWSQKKIAEEYAIHQTNIHYILSGKTWSHVT